MKISEKILMDLNGLIENGPITIAAFGDSVTHGALGTDEINCETVYWNRLRQKINAVRSYVPVNNVIAGIRVCDCCGKWKKLAETQDTTMLLANRINHPTKEMHELFADSLFKMIF